MDEKKKVSLAVVIMHCVCAVTWNINLFLHLADGYTNSVALVGDIFCAIAWDIFAILWFLRYRKSKKSKE